MSLKGEKYGSTIKPTKKSPFRAPLEYLKSYQAAFHLLETAVFLASAVMQLNVKFDNAAPLTMVSLVATVLCWVFVE